MKLISTITICIIMFLAGGCSNKKKFIEAEFEATVEKAHKTKNPELILSYLAKTSEMPEISKANAYVQLGISFVDNKNDKEAIKYFNKSLSYAGKETDNMSILIRCTALYESAKIYTREKDYSKSMYFYEKFLLEYKKIPSVKVNLADVYLDLSFCAMFAKKYSYQKKMLLKALKIQHDNLDCQPSIVAGTYIFLSSCCCNLGEYDEALNWNQKALKLCDKKSKKCAYVIAMAHFYKAQALYGKKQIKQAIIAMKKALFLLKKTKGSDHSKVKLAIKFLNQWQNK